MLNLSYLLVSGGKLSDTKPNRSSHRLLRFLIVFIVLLLGWSAAFFFLIVPHQAAAAPTHPKQVNKSSKTKTKQTPSSVPATPTHANYPTPPPSNDNAAPGVFPVHPNQGGYFEYRLAPGQSATATVVISNKTKASATYLVYPTRGITSDLTGVQYEQPEAGGSTNWINMKPHLITLNSGQGQRITVPITVPHGVKPGDYVDAIVGQGPPSANTSNTTHKGTTASILVTNRAIIAVVISVPGPNTTTIVTSKPTLVAQDNVRQVLNFPMKEIGDRLTAPYINAHVAACGSSSSLHTIKESLGEFVPFTSISYPVYLNSTALSKGCYTFAGSLRTGEVTTPFHYTFNVSSAATNVTPSRLLPSSTQQALNSLHAIERDVIGGIGVLIAAVIAWLVSRDWSRKKKQVAIVD